GKAFFTKDRYLHFSDPIKSFAVGTWVAATSVGGTVVYHELPELPWIYHSMAVIDAVLWMFFFFLCVKNFKRIFRERLSLNVHGVLLLSTVSTQSLVVLYSTLYIAYLPAWFFQIFLVIGTSFYVLSFILIFKRYMPFR